MTPHWNTSPRGQVITIDHDSKALAGNALGDPSRRELTVYLPPGYEDDTTRRYPVLWCLLGYTGSGRMAENVSAWSPPLSWRMDRLIQAGCPPAIVCMPDCFTTLGGSQYVDSPAVGNYRSYLVEELVPLVDDCLRTLPERDHRGVFGKSSGGYGAICLAMQAADVFGAVACHSGDMRFELVYGHDFHKVAEAISSLDELPAWHEELAAMHKRPWAKMSVLNVLCMAACYAPNMEREPPFALDLPFDLRTLERIPEVWERWLAHDPVHMIDEEKHQQALRSLRLLFLDCGSKDEFLLQFGARTFVEKLAALEIPHTYEEFDDGHMGLTYRYDRSVPLLARALSPDA